MPDEAHPQRCAPSLAAPATARLPFLDAASGPPAAGRIAWALYLETLLGAAQRAVDGSADARESALRDLVWFVRSTSDDVRDLDQLANLAIVALDEQGAAANDRLQQCREQVASIATAAWCSLACRPTPPT